MGDDLGKHIADPYRDTLVSVIVKQAMGVLYIKAPWLAIKPLGWIAEKIISQSTSWLLDRTILGINLTLIRVQTEANVQELNGLLDLVSKTPKEDHDKRERLEDEIIESSRKLIKLYTTKV